MAQQRLKGTIISQLLNDMLQAEPLSGIPQEKQVKLNLIISNMLALMFEAMDHKQERLHYDLQMDDLTDVLEHSALLFTQVRNKLIEQYSSRTQLNN